MVFQSKNVHFFYQNMQILMVFQSKNVRFFCQNTRILMEFRTKNVRFFANQSPDSNGISRQIQLAALNDFPFFVACSKVLVFLNNFLYKCGFVSHFWALRSWPNFKSRILVAFPNEMCLFTTYKL